LLLTSSAACNKTPALPPNQIIQWIKVGWTRGHSSFGDEVMAIWLGETQNL